MKWPQERAEVTHLSSHSPLCPEGAPSACPGEIRASQNPGPSGCCLDLDFAGEEAPHPCGSQIHSEMLGLEQGHTSLPSPHRGPGHLVPRWREEKAAGWPPGAQESEFTLPVGRAQLSRRQGGPRPLAVRVGTLCRQTWAIQAPDICHRGRPRGWIQEPGGKKPS